MLEPINGIVIILWISLFQLIILTLIIRLLIMSVNPRDEEPMPIVFHVLYFGILPTIRSLGLRLALCLPWVWRVTLRRGRARWSVANLLGILLCIGVSILQHFEIININFKVLMLLLWCWVSLCSCILCLSLILIVSRDVIGVVHICLSKMIF